MHSKRENNPTITFSDRLSVFLRNAGLRGLDSFLQAKKYNNDEPRKAVVTRDLRVALLRSWIHVLPISVFIALAFLNMKGYYIGSTLQGLVDPIWQTFDILLLQICAKLHELLVVASLSIIVTDILRHILLSPGSGLPLGLLVAQSSFSSLSYFWSLEFTSGCKGLKSNRTAILVAVPLIVAGLIAILAGPSSALLIVPKVRDHWAAGTTEFWINGTADELWPKTLNKDHVGGTACVDPTFTDLNAGQLNRTGCSWAGWAQLGEFFRNNHLNDDNENITINEGLATREVVYWSSSPAIWQETWALGTNAAIGLASDNIQGSWYNALFRASRRKLSPSKVNFKYRIQSASVSTVAGHLPAIRVACRTNTNITFNDTAISLQYPYLPQYGIDDRNTTYRFNASLPAVDVLSTQWFKPKGEGEQLLSNGTSVSFLPSAFLNIWSPVTNNETNGTAWTCSVDARWAPGVNVGNHLGDQTFIGSDFITTAELTDTRDPVGEDPTGKGFLPKDDGNWITVDLGLDWLNQLTPHLTFSSNATAAFTPNDASSWTTLASILQGSGIDNTTNAVGNWGDLRSPIESMIASQVADGMSRIGFSKNGGSLDRIATQGEQANYSTEPPELFAEFLNGRTSFPPRWTNDTSNLTRLEWHAFISGYAYKADSLAYYLALALLLTHSLIAATHTVYRCTTAISSEAWTSSGELLVLAQQSTPAKNGFADTSAGIQRGKTYQQSLRIRATNNDPKWVNSVGEELQIIVEDPDWTDKANGFQGVCIDQKYGARKHNHHPSTY